LRRKKPNNNEKHIAIKWQKETFTSDSVIEELSLQTANNHGKEANKNTYTETTSLLSLHNNFFVLNDISEYLIIGQRVPFIATKCESS
jgi:hypothetical protein